MTPGILGDEDPVPSGPEPVATRVVVTGAAGAIGRRLVRRLAADGVEVLALDRRAQGPSRPGVDAKRVDLAVDDLSSLFVGADAVVHLATVMDVGEQRAGAADLERAVLRRVLDAAAAAAVGQVVVISTAMVYGAWAANPVPITEDAAVRPNPDLEWACVRADLERLALEWRTGRPGTSLTVLRPTAVVTDDNLGRIADALRRARSGVAAEGDPPVQYLHGDDLVAAIATVVAAGVDGVVNVAPDGWIPPDALADLEGPRARLRVPAWVARALAVARSRLGLAPVHPGLVAYTAHPWVVANDRLRALGWTAGHTNEEAWVVSHEPGPLDRLPARRRQELALAVAAGSVVVAAAGVAALVIRLRRRR